MRVFHCDHCGHLLFFENVVCVQCGRTVAFEPDSASLHSLEAGGDGTWSMPTAPRREFRLCKNYAAMHVCNWVVDAADPLPYCRSCRLTTVIPDVSTTGAREAWYRLEVAKRRLLFTLMGLALPIEGRTDNPTAGLAFEFKADVPNEVVLTGHASGVITIDVAEADDSERERRRTAVHEPYRTLLGHMRHESGHYYWDRLVKGGPQLEAFRSAFGDERLDYQEALRRHYEQGAPADWQTRFVSAYASAHPWEDWAETWAHYLHIFDSLETAAACGMALRPRRQDEPSLPKAADAAITNLSFERLLDGWFPLTYVINNLNRGLGLPDAYPFVLSGPATVKLRFVHDLIHAASAASSTALDH